MNNYMPVYSWFNNFRLNSPHDRAYFYPAFVSDVVAVDAGGGDLLEVGRSTG